MHLDEILENLPAKRALFAIRYLGLLLSVSKLRTRDFQFLVDKITNKLNGWHGRNLSMAGRLTLIKSVITSQAIYLLSALKAPKEILEFVDSRRRQFLLAGSERITGGKCKVNWPRSTRPKAYGGLGILHLGKFARALRLRWLWTEWTTPEVMWASSETPCTNTDRLLFAASTALAVGDGTKISFWNNAWLQGLRPRDVAPHVFNIS